MYSNFLEEILLLPERLKVADSNRIKLLKKITRGYHLLEPRWNGLFLIIFVPHKVAN